MHMDNGSSVLAPYFLNCNFAFFFMNSLNNIINKIILVQLCFRKSKNSVAQYQGDGKLVSVPYSATLISLSLTVGAIFNGRCHHW